MGVGALQCWSEFFGGKSVTAQLRCLTYIQTHTSERVKDESGNVCRCEWKTADDSQS